MIFQEAWGVMEQPDVIRLNLPASYKYLNVVGASVAAMLSRLEQLPDPEINTHKAELAVHEICTNIVEHAYSGCEDGRIEITLTVYQQPARLIVDLKDSGTPFEPTTVPEPDLERGQIRGYGLFLARKLMDEVTYYQDRNHNYWQLVINF